jgi:glycosyltransferase involved in cell wall biosynthesis
MAQTVKDPQPIALVSFVVPAWNEEVLLGRTLKCIFEAAQLLNIPFEVVVADDASTDRTAEIAREHSAQVVSINRRQIAATRNAGARASKGELLIFVDADTLVTPEVVRAALEAIRSGAVGGGCAVYFDGRVPGYARRLLPIFIRLYRAAGLAAGCFLFCTRRAFDAVGGFDEKFYASEECWMSWALRRRGRFVLLRETVHTSARKLRTYSGGEILKMLFWLTVRGRLSSREQRGMEIWYGPRRPDPDAGS